MANGNRQGGFERAFEFGAELQLKTQELQIQRRLAESKEQAAQIERKLKIANILKEGQKEGQKAFDNTIANGGTIKQAEQNRQRLLNNTIVPSLFGNEDNAQTTVNLVNEISAEQARMGVDPSKINQAAQARLATETVNQMELAQNQFQQQQQQPTGGLLPDTFSPDRPPIGVDPRAQALGGAPDPAEVRSTIQTPVTQEAINAAQASPTAPGAPNTFRPSGFSIGAGPFRQEFERVPTRAEQLQEAQMKAEGQALAQEQKKEAELKRNFQIADRKLTTVASTFKGMANLTQEQFRLPAGRIAGLVNATSRLTGKNPLVAAFNGLRVEAAVSLAKLAAPSARIGRHIMREFMKTLPTVFSTMDESSAQVQVSLQNAMATAFNAIYPRGHSQEGEFVLDNDTRTKFMRRIPEISAAMTAQMFSAPAPDPARTQAMVKAFEKPAEDDKLLLIDSDGVLFTVPRNELMSTLWANDDLSVYTGQRIEFPSNARTEAITVPAREVS